jgi:hypothetical protein
MGAECDSASWAEAEPDAEPEAGAMSAGARGWQLAHGAVLAAGRLASVPASLAACGCASSSCVPPPGGATTTDQRSSAVPSGRKPYPRIAPAGRREGRQAGRQGGSDPGRAAPCHTPRTRRLWCRCSALAGAASGTGRARAHRPPCRRARRSCWRALRAQRRPRLPPRAGRRLAAAGQTCAGQRRPGGWARPAQRRCLTPGRPQRRSHAPSGPPGR